MQVNAYQHCQKCDRELEEPTVYRRHAVCQSCD